MFLNGDLGDLLAPGPLNVGYQCCEIPDWNLLVVKLVHWPCCHPPKPHGIFGRQGRLSSISTSVCVKQRSKDKWLA